MWNAPRIEAFSHRGVKGLAGWPALFRFGLAIFSIEAGTTINFFMRWLGPTVTTIGATPDRIQGRNIR
jgi:hypothetical protein